MDLQMLLSLRPHPEAQQQCDKQKHSEAVLVPRRPPQPPQQA
jgi:hypothetical protein